MNQLIFHFRKLKTPLILLIAAMGTSCSEQEQEYEVEIPVSAVPEQILSAVNKELPGIEITEAEIESNAELRYELEGKIQNFEKYFWNPIQCLQRPVQYYKALMMNLRLLKITCVA